MAIDHDELSHRFQFHPASTEDVRDRHQSVRELFEYAGHRAAVLCPESRELSLALTKIEEAMFWANAAVARHK